MKKWYGENFKLGILGGGQLGRMFIQEAINYNVHVAILEGSKKVPCGDIASEFVVGNIKDYDDVLNFGRNMDVLTVEIEHVNVDALKQLEKEGVKVFPQPDVLKIIQDKGLQKQFYTENNIPTAPFSLVDTAQGLDALNLEFPFVQKLRKGGYDGKGVKLINSSEQLNDVFDAPAVIEKFVPFEKELSVIVARNESGEIKSFPVVECEFNEKLNLVEFLFAPAAIPQEIENNAKLIAQKVINAFGMVGILAVELFLTKDGDLLVNEVAPRPHNSGHHTIECNFTSQFEQHLRSITDQPLGSTDIVLPGVMINLIGAEGFGGAAFVDNLDLIMKTKGAYLHNYGKQITKPNRKMGHITVVNKDINEAKQIARELLDKIRIISK